VWDNPRLLEIAAGALVGVAALMLSLAGLGLLLRPSLLPVREVVVTSEMHRTTRQDIELAVRRAAGGNFFAYSLAGLRASLEQLPWVRHAEVRRVWPDRIDVAIEEHVALGRWGDDALVDTFGERFPGKTDEALPVFIAPAGNEAEVARRYASFARLVAPLGAGVERVVLTPRLAWQLRLSNGLHLMLGRDVAQAEARLARFVEVYPATLGMIPRRHESVDLRYPNGFALRLPPMKS
jgi:cell division protein FtsQ